MKLLPFAWIFPLVSFALPTHQAFGASPPIDFTHPVMNLAHDPDAKEPANPRKILSTRYGKQWLETHHAQRADQWVPYPTVDDRAKWQGVSEAIRQAALEAAEQVKDKPSEPLTATLALNYWRNGDRADYGARAAERQTRLQKLVL